MLRSQDIIVALKAHLRPGHETWTYEKLGRSVGLSASQAHASLKRMEESRLFRPADQSLWCRAFADFARHGIPFLFPVLPGPEVIGVPTAHSAPPMSTEMVAGEDYVWPYEAGIVGKSIAPLHRIAPRAALDDSNLHAALALIDSFRLGRARERGLAGPFLTELLAAPKRGERWVADRIERTAGT